MIRRELSVYILIGFATAVMLPMDRCAAQGYSPEEATRHMTVPEGLIVQLFAFEPMIRQPVAMTFDERGRLWVIQYLQYPNPAGLTRVSVDRYSRTTYDRVPEPPPHGPCGADRVTILEDTDHDGHADTAKDFVGGLNLASGLLLGNGGVYVLQTPYLLFYRDRNRDDVPDGDPEVLLSGFGMEDAHAVANSLTWGPDGWLYGAQGSTVTANICGIGFQQAIWRYHPTTRAFELFAEGGGNTWGVDFDRYGNLLAGTNVGGYALLHQVQGGYYWKSFGKHGELHNPYAFGYLEHVPYTDFRGGHVTCGGIVYQGNSLPDRLRNRYIAANLLSHAVYWHELETLGSTFRARHGGEFLAANDTWFAPVDLAVAPDGAVFVADWHDQRTAHPDPDADWDRSNGRIYRVQAVDAKRADIPDLRSMSTTNLARQLNSENGWLRATARRLIIERGDASIAANLLSSAQAGTGDGPLDFLWTYYGLSGLDATAAGRLIADANEHIRRWTIRLLGDTHDVPESLRHRMIELAAKEESSIVRSQLACTAQRLRAELALPIVSALCHHDRDADDLQIPLLLWWALERHATDRASILALLSNPRLADKRIVKDHLLPRIGRRWTATGDAEDLAACATLLEQTPDAGARGQFIQGMNLGLRGRRFEKPPDAMRSILNALWSASRSADVIELASRLAMSEARREIISRSQDGTLTTAERARWIGLFGEWEAPVAVPVLWTLVDSERQPREIRAAALAALGRFEDPTIAGELVVRYENFPAELRPGVVDLLVARRASAHELVNAVQAGRISAADVGTAHLRQIAALQDADLDRTVAKLWGQVREATPEEKLAVVRRLNNDLRAAPGVLDQGRNLFREHCAKCHKLFGEGSSVGPDLTTANRTDRDFLLISLVDPNNQVRKEYLSHLVAMNDGRALTGIVVEDMANTIVLVDAAGQRVLLAKSDIEAIEPAATSLMPEGQIEKLSPQQLRDLFSYLQSPQGGSPERHVTQGH